MHIIDSTQFVTAVLKHAEEHGKEDAYQSATAMLALKQITQDQWHDAVQALYDD